MKVSVLVPVILSAVLLTAPRCASPNTLSVEVASLQERFSTEVGGVQLEDGYKQLLSTMAAELLSTGQNGFSPASQLLLLIDRNHMAQTASLAFFDSETKRVLVIGSTKTSTGNPKRLGYYETPTGVFRTLPRT